MRSPRQSNYFNSRIRILRNLTPARVALRVVSLERNNTWLEKPRLRFVIDIVHDLHATILKFLGFDHEKFTFRASGRDFRLTDVHGHVGKEMIA